MNRQDLGAAMFAASQTTDALRAALKASDPVAAIVLMPLIKQSVDIFYSLEQLHDALLESK